MIHGPLASEEGQYVIRRAPDRLHDLDAVQTHSDAQLQRSSRRNNPVVDATAGEFDLMMVSPYACDLADTVRLGQFAHRWLQERRVVCIPIEAERGVWGIPRLGQQRLLDTHSPADRVAPARREQLVRRRCATMRRAQSAR